MLYLHCVLKKTRRNVGLRISVNNMNMIWKQAPPTHTSVCSLSENSRRGRPRHSGDYAQHLSLCCCREGDDGGRKETMVRKQYVTGEIRLLITPLSPSNHCAPISHSHAYSGAQKKLIFDLTDISLMGMIPTRV